MRISDWSSEVCSSDLVVQQLPRNNSMSAISHLRRLNTPVPRESKDARVRQLRNPDWGGKCPNDTSEGAARGLTNPQPDRKSVVKGKRVSVRLDLGGRRLIKKK